MKKSIIIGFVFFFLVAFLPLNAQWAKIYGTSNNEEARSIQSTSDGGYIVAGTLYQSYYNGDFWVVKIDSAGDISWQKTYGGSNDEMAHSIQQTNDGGYVVAGYIYKSWSDSDLWIIKLDSTGVIEWQKTYGEDYDSIAYSIQQTSDGGYVVAGSTTINYDRGTDFWILKLNAAGVIEWQRLYGGCFNDGAYSVKQTIDGGYIVAGYSNEYSSFGRESDFWILKLNSAGIVEWQRLYGSCSTDVAQSIQQTSDRGYMVAGYASLCLWSAGGEDFWVMKLNVTGDIEWQKTYGSSYNERAYSIQQTNDDGYIVAGYQESSYYNTDFLVIKLTAAGDIEWQKTYGGQDREIAYSILETTNPGYIVAGYTNSFGSGGKDLFIINLDSNGDIGPNNTIIGNPNITVSNSSVLLIDTTLISEQTTITPGVTAITPQISSANIYELYPNCTLPPTISLSPSELVFRAPFAGYNAPTQTFSIQNLTCGTLNWTISSDSDWLSFSPTSGTGDTEITVSVDTTNFTSVWEIWGYIKISSPDASNSPKQIPIRYKHYDHTKVGINSPFGSMDSPLDGSTVSGSLPVSGWALDDKGVTKVEIKRDSVAGDPVGAIGLDGLIYIGDAIFVEGARSDVESFFPGYLNNSKAGWGYMMLTNSLPNGGNGSFTIYAYASDADGNSTEIGKVDITCDNSSRVKPFGTIDFPAQGATISGTAYANNAWALTALPNTISTDGSTIAVWVDGVSIAHPTYNLYRSDVEALFPGYNNSSGAGGTYYLNTTLYDNGVHTIWWTVDDDAGNEDGIGSRYFSINNPAATINALDQSGFQGRNQSTFLQKKSIEHLIKSFLPIKVKKGFKERIRPEKTDPDSEGNFHVRIKEGERVEIDLEGPGNTRGYLVVGEQLQPLPIGSTLDAAKEKFYWMPGPGFIGEYKLLFVHQDITGEARTIELKITIRPKFK